MVIFNIHFIWFSVLIVIFNPSVNCPKEVSETILWLGCTAIQKISWISEELRKESKTISGPSCKFAVEI
jgi:hypothetical protein